IIKSLKHGKEDILTDLVVPPFACKRVRIRRHFSAESPACSQHQDQRKADSFHWSISFTPTATPAGTPAPLRAGTPPHSSRACLPAGLAESAARRCRRPL